MLRRGRLEKAMDPLASEYTSSMRADVRIFKPVVDINLAHVIMLAERGLIAPGDAAKLLRALLELRERGSEALELRPELEDIHMAVEQFIISKTSEGVGGKLHTAKSRNDQVACAIRMVLREELLETQMELLAMVSCLLELAGKNTTTVMPGYTHLQVAEPTTFAHYLASYAFAFLRDAERLSQAFEQANSCPMGACALAGTSFPIDPSRVAHLLGFKRTFKNTLDAVGSRDFALQAMSALAIAMTNLSRLAEELVLWSSAEFNMVEVPEEFAATSSIMPQKRNPVVAELARARVGRVSGDLFAALTIMKGLPQSYNLDMQDLTPLLWDALNHTKESAKVMSRMLGAIAPKPEVMRKRAEESFASATELADTLVRVAGMAFRDAHAVVGRMISKAVREGKTPSKLTVDDLGVASRELLGKEIRLTDEEFRAALDPELCVKARSLLGGPAPRAMNEQLNSLRKAARGLERLTKARIKGISKAEARLVKEAKRRSRP